MQALAFYLLLCILVYHSVVSLCNLREISNKNTIYYRVIHIFVGHIRFEVISVLNIMLWI
jgi:hypothetical protein